MLINNSTNINFGAIKYLKCPATVISEKINRPEILTHIAEPNPPVQLKSIIDSSGFFKNLATKTDVYISSKKTTNKKNPLWLFVATFMDPTDSKKTTVDELNFQEHFQTEESWYYWLAHKISKLPEMYEDLKETESGRIIFIENDGYVTLGE